MNVDKPSLPLPHTPFGGKAPYVLLPNPLPPVPPNGLMGLMGLAKLKRWYMVIGFRIFLTIKE